MCGASITIPIGNQNRCVANVFNDDEWMKERLGRLGLLSLEDADKCTMKLSMDAAS